MNKLKIVFLGIIAFVLTSCITSREVRYLQPSESLVLNEEGLVSYNMQEYRVTKSDMFSLNIKRGCCSVLLPIQYLWWINWWGRNQY